MLSCRSVFVHKALFYAATNIQVRNYEHKEDKLLYNKFLEYLMDNSPNAGITQIGIRFRKIISPLVRLAIPFTIPTKLRVIRRAKMPNRPIIFAAAHGFKEDAECTLVTANRCAYMLIGALTQVFRTFQGVTAWLVGPILVNRLDKESRRASKEKVIRAIQLGASIIIFPEGTWNKSPNLLMNKLFPGVYDIAKATGALVAPIATHRESGHVYSILDECFDITQYSQTEGMLVLRDKLATLRWELMETYSPGRLEDMPPVEQANSYWENFINDLMAEVEFYDYEEELHTKFVDKNIIEYCEVFSHLSDLQPNCSNAFLFNKRNHN